MEIKLILLMDWLHPYPHWHLACTIITLIWKQVFQPEHNPLHPMLHWHHMSQLSCIMLQLAQTNQVMADQQWIHLAMVTMHRQQADAFNALAAATEQRKYDALFAAIPKYDGINKEDCAVWISRISSLAASTEEICEWSYSTKLKGTWWPC